MLLSNKNESLFLIFIDWINIKYRKTYFLGDRFAFRFYFFFEIPCIRHIFRLDLGNRTKETMESVDALERKLVETTMKKFLSASCSC